MSSVGLSIALVLIKEHYPEHMAVLSEIAKSGAKNVQKNLRTKGN